MGSNNIMIGYVVSVHEKHTPENLYIMCSCGHEGDVPLPYSKVDDMPYTLNVTCSNCEANRRFIVDYLDFHWGDINYLEPILEEN